MSDPIIHNPQRAFYCIHCNGKILIPYDLPPTTGPCPHCSGVITSPAVSDDLSSPSQPPSPASVQAVQQPIPVPAAVGASDVKDPVPQYYAAASKRPHERKNPFISAILVCLLLGLFIGVGFVLLNTKRAPSTVDSAGRSLPFLDPAASEAQYLRIGWKADAYTALTDFMNARTVKEKLPFIINGPALAEKLDDFYGGVTINDSDTPADAFSTPPALGENVNRGIFLLKYEQSPQFDIKQFFRPLATQEVQWGLDEADLLLSSMANAKNFTMDSVNVMAFFLRTPNGLKLDWETFAQTKYRTFRNFIDVPEPDRSGVFRVIIWEDVPDKGTSVSGSHTYQISDPANMADSVRVNVPTDSEIGKTLSKINWLGVAGNNKPSMETATIELKWHGETNPQIEISRFICWEFLGLGGKESPPSGSTPASSPALVPAPVPAPR